MQSLGLFSILMLSYLLPPENQTNLPSRGTCETPLILAIYKRDVKEIRRMISSGTDLNVKVCDSGKTALSEAIAEGLPEIARDLISAGANPNETGNDGTSMLMAACFYCQDETVSLLLKKGTNVNARGKDGGTALMEAVSQCMDGVLVARLLRSGADVNVRTKTGQTALTVAAFYGNVIAVKQLVAAGADLDAKSWEGTALEIAKKRIVGRKPSHDVIYDFLRRLSEN